MKYEELLKELKDGMFHPVYFLEGEEPFYIDQISDYIQENVLDETEREFNQTIFYGKDSDPGVVVEACKRFPMMSERQVVILKEAQAMRGIAELEGYIKSPLDSTLFVVCYKGKKIDKRSAFGKMLSKQTAYLNAEKVKDYKLADWISSYVKSKGLSIGPVGAKLLSDSLGTDLSKVSNELNKLALIVPKGEEITPAIIQSNIGISKDFNVFELQNALGKKDHRKAHEIINYFGANNRSNPLIMTISSLYGFFSKIFLLHYLPDKSSDKVASALKVHPFFVKDYMNAARNYNRRKLVNIISDLREIDLKLKGVGNVSASEADLGKELVARILND